MTWTCEECGYEHPDDDSGKVNLGGAGERLCVSCSLWAKKAQLSSVQNVADTCGGSSTAQRNLMAKLRMEIDSLTHERDAYREAKAENDERFMLERDEARRELVESRERLRLIGQMLIDEIGASGPENVEVTAGRAGALIRRLRADLTQEKMAHNSTFQLAATSQRIAEELQRQLTELKRGLTPNNDDYQMAFLEAHLSHYKELLEKVAKEKAEAESFRQYARCLENDNEKLDELLKRARGTKRCQICGASHVKGQEHDDDCPVGLLDGRKT